LQEFARRLTFTVLISNGDAHLKNWSLIYPDRRIPRLAPAYDLVSTAFYLGDGEQLGLKFGGTRRFGRITVSTFDRLENRLGASPANLADCVAQLVARVNEYWPAHEDKLTANPALLASVHDSIVARSRSVLRRVKGL
jgi:serine/threonine-protein kinase HipA